MSGLVTHGNARIAVLPRALASEIITSAVSWAGWAVSIVILLMTVPVLVDSFGANPSDPVVPMIAVVGVLGLLVVNAIRPGTLARAAYLVGGCVLAVVYIVGLAAADRSEITSVAYLLNRVPFVLVIAAIGVRRPRRALLWSFAGFVAANVAIVAGDLIAGIPINFGWGPAVAVLITSLVYLALMAVGAAQRRLADELRELEDATTKLALEGEFEQRAAALIHDTVLNDLTVVMNSDGPISDKVRDRFRRDVATLDQATWLRESRPSVIADPSDSALRNGMVGVVSEMQWLGLSVDVTGNPEDEVVRLSPERLEATLDAVRACLQNVLEHSGARKAGVALGLTDDAVTIMVIDEGVGFDPSAIADDRLGLRNSVIRRVQGVGGTVRVFSSSGAGTSIMISMPGEIVLPTGDAS